MKNYSLIFVLAIIVIGLVVGLVYFAGRKPSTKDAVTALLNQKFNQTLTVAVSSEVGNYAKGTYNEPAGGGGVWFAAKTSNGWELASAGNGIVSCDAANRYNFPKDLIPQCLDTQNGNQLLTR